MCVAKESRCWNHLQDAREYDAVNSNRDILHVGIYFNGPSGLG
jgi:hypothetical protein